MVLIETNFLNNNHYMTLEEIEKSVGNLSDINILDVIIKEESE